MTFDAVACCYSLLFLLYINIQIGKKMLNARLEDDHLYGKLLFTWLSLVMCLVVSCFVLSLFPRDVLDEIWDLIELVSEGFPTYFFIYIFISQVFIHLTLKRKMILIL